MDENSPTIVCIEDEQEMIDLFELILSRQNINVIGAVGGKEGLEQIRKSKADVVLLDLMMPEMDGWEVYQMMKASEDMRDIPVIVVTAKSAAIDKVLGLNIAGVDEYITKPFGPEELLASINKVLAKDNVVE